MANASEFFSGVPAGTTVASQRPRAPAGWYKSYGQALSRTGEPALFEALCPLFTGDTTSGSAVITNIDDTDGMEVGQTVEGSGIPSSTTIDSIDSATQITLSQNATATASSVNMRFFSFGNGDGSTTFNLADMRGRAPVGLDDMGGASANRVPTGTDNGEFGASPGLGSTGGLSRISFNAGGSNASVGSSRLFLVDLTSASSDGTTAGSQNVGHVAHQPSILLNWFVKA